MPRKSFICGALLRLKKEFPEDFQYSSLYLTDPYLHLQQPSYYNCCAGLKTSLAPRDLLDVCQALEREFGRVRSNKGWQSRTIDIDILLYGERRIAETGLVVPHYDLENRDFFLIPLLELNPGLKYPVGGESVVTLLEALSPEKRTYPQKLLKPVL